MLIHLSTPCFVLNVINIFYKLGGSMSKKKARELMREVRREGVFSELIERSKKKKVYKFQSSKDGVMSVLFFILAILVFAVVNIKFN